MILTKLIYAYHLDIKNGEQELVFFFNFSKHCSQPIGI